jgi:hypothetical protein
MNNGKRNGGVMVLKEDDFRITAWGEKTENVNSQYGKVKFEDWLRLEKVRIEQASGCLCQVIVDRRGMLALFYVVSENSKKMLEQNRAIAKEFGIRTMQPATERRVNAQPIEKT